MEDEINKSVIVFSGPFTVPGFAETLPAGDYEIETGQVSPPNHLNPGAWTASVLVELHLPLAYSGLVRTVTVSLADLEVARARDKLTGRATWEVVLDSILADPIVGLVMEADGVSVAQLRHLFAERETPSDVRNALGSPKRREPI